MTDQFTPANTAAGHPIRRRLPKPRAVRIRQDDHDIKLFVLSFTAFFICIYTFIF